MQRCACNAKTLLFSQTSTTERKYAYVCASAVAWELRMQTNSQLLLKAVYGVSKQYVTSSFCKTCSRSYREVRQTAHCQHRCLPKWHEVGCKSLCRRRGCLPYARQCFYNYKTHFLTGINLQVVVCKCSSTVCDSRRYPTLCTPELTIEKQLTQCNTVEKQLRYHTLKLSKHLLGSPSSNARYKPNDIHRICNETLRIHELLRATKAKDPPIESWQWQVRGLVKLLSTQT